MSQTIPEQIKERQRQAPNGAVNITDLVTQMIQPPPGFSMKLMLPQEAAIALKGAQINNLIEFCKTVNITVTQRAKLKEWLNNHDKLMDGCITFEFSPCSMGIILIATNTLTKQIIDLTEY